MTPAIDITTAQRKTLLTLLRQFIPGVLVWAYGSRVKWTARPNSDLDLVAFTTPAQNPRVSELKEALAESNLPFPVDLHVWDEVPERFHAIIRNEYVVLQEAEEKQQREVSGWQTIRLGSACEKIGSGATPRGGSEVYQATGISLIRSQNIYNDGFKRVGLAFIGDKHARELENVNVLPGDVLLNITGDSVARVCQVPEKILPARVNQHVAIIRPKKNILDARFLHYFLIHPQTQAHMLGLAGAGATRNALTKGMIESFEIKAPSFSEQRAIASVLGALDDKIELNRRMNETLEALAQSLFKSWFVDATQSALPKGWRESTIGEEVRVVGGSTPSTTKPEFWEGGTHHWATPKDLSNLNSPVLLETERKITDAGIQQISSGLLPVGTVLLSSRAPIGYLVIAEVPVAVNQGFIGMICDGSLPNHYVRLWTKANKDAIEGRANGTTFMEISKSNFRPIPVIVPQKPVLDDFQKQVEPLHRRVVSNLKESRTLAAMRDALLPKLLSGELRVPAAAQLPEARA